MMDYENWMERCYGLEAMSVEEEMNLPAPMKQTRNNKVKMIDQLNLISRRIDGLINYAKRIPVHNNEVHAKLVQELADAVNEIGKVVSKAEVVGRR